MNKWQTDEKAHGQYGRACDPIAHGSAPIRVAVADHARQSLAVPTSTIESIAINSPNAAIDRW
jgi:hypothetical protein